MADLYVKLSDDSLAKSKIDGKVNDDIFHCLDPVDVRKSPVKKTG